MAWQMKMSNEKLEGKDVMPAGTYDVRFIEFKPKFSKDKGDGSKPSLNLNAKMEVINHSNEEFNGRFVYEGLNENAGWVQQDFSHAFGFPMETDGTASWLPGQWDGTEGEASTYTYKGPLTGQIARIDLAIDSYNNKENNKVSRYYCKVKDCATKFPKLTHSTNLLRKK